MLQSQGLQAIGGSKEGYFERQGIAQYYGNKWMKEELRRTDDNEKDGRASKPKWLFPSI